MSLSIAKTNSDELLNKIKEIVSKLNAPKPQILETIIIYNLSNNLDYKSYFFDSQYSSLGTPIEKIKEIINSSIDFLFVLFKHNDFNNINFANLENELKNNIFAFFEEKLNNNTLNSDNYQDFIDYFLSSYNSELIISLLRNRILISKEQFKEFKAILEYMTFSGRNDIEEQELGRLEKAINFRLNLLKNYNVDYFCKNFCILENQAKIFPKEFQTGRFFYPLNLFKDMKNLILRLERERDKTQHIQHEGKDLISRQLELLKENQETLSRLKGHQQ
jgi:hypothetical protein